MPASTPPARSIFDRLVRVETMLWNRCDDEVRQRAGLPLGRLEVLRVIADIEQCRVNDIVARLLITVGAASKLVDRLEASGHCQRHPHPDDRRSSAIAVTELGSQALAEAQRVMEPLLQRYFAAANLEQLDGALSRIAQALGQDGGRAQSSEDL